MGFPKSMSKAQWAWLLDRYLEGYYMRDIAAFVGVDPRTVMRYWALHGLKTTRHGEELPPLSSRKQEFVRIGEERRREDA